jgi:hypothetical protein
MVFHAGNSTAFDGLALRERPSDNPQVRLPALLVLALAGCGAAPGAEAAVDAGPSVALPRDPVTSLIGELHLHEFPLGGHAWAAFIDTPVPVAGVSSDQLVVLDTAPTATAGSCILFGSPVCHTDCGPSAFCYAPDTCRPFTPLKYLDGGAIDITGSRLHPRIHLWYTDADTGYASDPPPGADLLFAGGELLRVDGGAGATRLAGVIPAPEPVVVRAPDLTAPLHIPTSTPLDVRWDASGAAEVVILISVSRQGGAAGEGDYATIRCVGPDGGEATVPASLLAALPPPPRSVRLEVERDNQLFLKTVTPGVGVLVHAAFSAWENGAE